MNAPLLRLLHLASPALPIGAFHFSQGLEYVVHRGWVHDEASAASWIEGVADGVIGRLDLPMIFRAHDACAAENYAALRALNDLLVASRETSELRAEDLHMGAALAKVLADHELDFSVAEIKRPVYAIVFAFACSKWGISRSESASAYAWSWCENQVIAAVKLVPLGQRVGQRILHRLALRLPGIIKTAEGFDEADIGVNGVMPGFASARHEVQYTRLFRS